MNTSAILKQMKSRLSVSMSNSSLLHSKFVLYLVFGLVLVNLFFSMLSQRYRYISTVFLIGFLISQFTKNMTVILLLSLVLSNVIMMFWTSNGALNEGFEDGADEKKSGDKEEEEDMGEGEAKKDEQVKKLIDDKGKLVEMKKDAEELLNTQKQILDGLNQIEPLLTRAEKLSEKFSTMK